MTREAKGKPGECGGWMSREARFPQVQVHVLQSHLVVTVTPGIHCEGGNTGYHGICPILKWVPVDK